MTVQVELWELITFLIGLLIAFLTFTFAAGRLLLAQIGRSLDQRFEGLKETDKARDAARASEISKIESALNTEAESWRRVEREVLLLQAELPNQYVRRDDWIRFGGSIDYKMDGLHKKIDDVKERLNERN